MNVLKPQDLLEALAAQLDVGCDFYPYVPDNPTLPAVCAYIESWPFNDPAGDITVVLLLQAGTIDAQNAWNLLHGWIEGEDSLLEQIDADNTLDGTVSSVLPFEIRNIGYSAPDGRARVLQAEMVLHVLR